MRVRKRAGESSWFLDDAKAPNCQKNNGFSDLGNYSEWPKVAGAVIQAERALACGVAEAVSPRARSSTFLPQTSRRDMGVHTRSLFLRHPLRGDEKACETLVAEPWLSSLGLDLRSSLKTSIFRRIPNLWDMSIARLCGPDNHIEGSSIERYSQVA
mgnify:CR=1 FL=1